MSENSVRAEHAEGHVDAVQPDPLPVNSKLTDAQVGRAGDLSHRVTKLEREKQSLQKMVLGMATKKYGFNAKAVRSGAPAAIAGDLSLSGILLSEETILKHLREAFSEKEKWR